MAGAVNIIDMAVKIVEVPSALKKVFSSWGYTLIAALAAMVMFGVLVFLPVGRVSVDIFYYQITGLDTASLAIMFFFSVVLGMLFSLNIYLLRRTHGLKKKIIGGGILSMVSSFTAGIFGSTVCVACLSILLSFLGIPTITFLVSYRKEFFLLAAAIALVSLYFACRAVVEHKTCKVCNVQA